VQLSAGMGGGLTYLEVAPPDAPADLPLVVALHGRGASAEDLAPLAQAIAAPWRWVFPNARLPLDVGGWEGYAWYDLAAPERDIPPSRRAIEGLLGDLWARLGVGPARTALLGFSQGGVMTLDVGLRAAMRFAGLVVLSGYLALVDGIEAALPRATHQRLLIIHGTEDPIVPVGRARATHQQLVAAGLAPEYHELEMGHEVTSEVLALVARFLEAGFALASGAQHQP